MGIFTRPKLVPTVAALPVVSPWSDAQLQRIVLNDVFGTLDELPLTRAEAMRVPAVAKARNLLVSHIAQMPLRAYAQGSTELSPKQPTWLSRTDSVSPWHRMAWTVDDILFYGAAVWYVTRGADGYPLTMDRVPPEQWTVTQGQILVDGEPASESEVIYIPGPQEGLLDLASRTIRGGRDQESAWTDRIRNPIAAMELRETVDSGMTPEEIQGFVDAWKRSRQAGTGAVGYTPYGFELIDHGTGDPALFENGRNSIRVDIGAFCNIPSALMDSGVSSSSITYSTQEGQRSTFFTSTIPLWAEPIAQRLSLDGEFPIVPNGQRVRFDATDLLAPIQSPTGAPLED